jgi:hypothetical protein
MRLVAGGTLLLHGVAALRCASAPAALHLLCAATGALLLLGLWTPVVGALVAIGAVAHGFSSPADAGFDALLATLGVALALLGPGAWSVDARLFGWRRVDIPGRDSEGHASRHETPLL